MQPTHKMGAVGPTRALRLGSQTPSSVLSPATDQMRPKLLPISAVLLMLLASCSALRPSRTYPHSPGEIADNPSILIDGSIPREEMSLRGVKLGDPKSAIKSTRIL